MQQRVDENMNTTCSETNCPANRLEPISGAQALTHHFANTALINHAANSNRCNYFSYFSQLWCDCGRGDIE